MSTRDHKPTDAGDDGARCIWDHEPWPCSTARIRRKVIMETVADLTGPLRPRTPEPVCCDQHAMAWQSRQEMVEEIEEWGRKEVEKIDSVKT